MLSSALALILALSLTCIGASPMLAQTTYQSPQSSISYVPKHPSVKDEQNIDLLYGLYRANKGQPGVLDTLPEGAATKILASRKSFVEFYYSPDENAFALRESMKLLRAMSCKVSRLTGVRGLDLASKIDGIDGVAESSNPELVFDKALFISLFKGAYEHFCPNLW